MKEEALHPWIEPELEARITALVLGEASDFEREELERLIGEKAELAMFRKRMEAVHGLLREVATGETSADDDDWKLGDENREAVLAVIDGEVKEKPVKNVAKEPVAKISKTEPITPQRTRFDWKRPMLRAVGIAAIIIICMGVLFNMFFIVADSQLESPAFMAAATVHEEADYSSESIKLQKIARPEAASAEVTSDLAINSMASSPIAIPEFDEAGSVRDATLGAQNFEMATNAPRTITTDSAQVAKSNPVVDSRSSLAAIQSNLDTYSKSPQVPILPSSSASSVVVAGNKIEMPQVEPYLYADAGGGGAIRGVAGQAVNGRETLREGADSFADRKDADVSFKIANLEKRVSTRTPSPSPKPSFDSPSLPASSKVTPKFSQTEAQDVTLGVTGEEMAKGLHFGEKKANQPAKRRNRMAGELAQGDLAFKKSVGDPFSEPAPAAATMDDSAGDMLVSSLANANDGFADAQAVRKMDRDAEGKGAKLGEDRKEILAARQLPEIKSVSARRQIAAADAPKKPIEAMAAGRGGAAGKKAKTKAPGRLAPAAAPKLAREKAAEEESMDDSPRTREMVVIQKGKTVVNKTPITVPTVNQTSAGSPIKEEVRYRIDKNNKPGEKDLADKIKITAGADITLTKNKAQHEWQRYPGSSKEAMDRLYRLTPRVVGGGKSAATIENVPKDPMEAIDESEEGFFIRGAQLNDVFQFLAKSADLNYFHNAELAAPTYTVTGPLQEGDPLQQMQELGSKYGINIQQKGKTVYAMSNEQLAQAPNQSGALRAGASASKTGGISIDSIVAANGSSQAIAGSKDEGFFIRGAQLNDVFIFLAKRGGLNYFHNPALAGDAYKVTGHLQEGDPLKQMEELAYMYGITFLQDGGTVQSLKAPKKKSPTPSGLNEKSAEEEAFSTFSLHVSDVSFKLTQAALAKGEWPDASKVRIEEFVNAFDYGDPMPKQSEKVACRMEQGIHPFLQQRNLMRVSMRTAAAGRSGDTPLRLTLLLDNSGSMERIDRQETVRRAFALLVQQLKPIDQVTLISFARQPRLLADKVSGAKSSELVRLIHNLPSEGGTNLEAALQLAFEKAREQKIENAQNRIIMLTDGAANLGDADPDSLAQMIETMRDAGIAFDAAGIGAEGLNDEILEALTRKGDGRYYLLDRPEDADAGFARQIAGALRPAAKNVKVQVEFNPDRVGRYKLLGFEKHRLKKEDFRNDKVDAAEMAAEEAGVAVYQFEAKPDGKGDVGSVSVRFRDMSTGQMVEKRWPIPYEADPPRLDQAAPSLRIASSAALLAAKLKGKALGQSVDLKMLSNFVAGLPDRYRDAQRVRQLQEMINQTRAASR